MRKGLKGHIGVPWRRSAACLASLLTAMACTGLLLSFDVVEQAHFWSILPSTIDPIQADIMNDGSYTDRLLSRRLHRAHQDAFTSGLHATNQQGEEDWSNQAQAHAETQPRCSSIRAPLKVFMYDLSPEFHFGMIEDVAAKPWPAALSDTPRYPGGLYQQHSPEYWLTADLLFPGNNSNAIRVGHPSDADVFFVPFFSSLSYNKYARMGANSRNVQLQRSLINYLSKQEAWNASGGVNHVIVMHHPNSMHVARRRLRAAIYVVADFGRYSQGIANVRKDVVSPYKHLLPSYEDDNSTFHSRPTLLFFQGAIVRKEGGAIRQKLYSLLKDETGVMFSGGNPARRQEVRSATDGMRSSKFCLHLAGDTPSSNRLFDAIASHCVPVIISNEIELPFEEDLDYTGFCIFVRPEDAVQKGYLVELLRSIGTKEWTAMWERLKQVEHHFEYALPSQEGDAVRMIWNSIAAKMPSVRQSKHRLNRFCRSDLFSSGRDPAG